MATLVPLFLAAILAGSVGCSRKPESKDEEAHPAPVKVVNAKLVALDERTELVGSTTPLPNGAARITAAIEGRVVSVLKDSKGQTIREGQRVEKGQVIVELDDRIARANLEKSQALLDEFSEQKIQGEIAEKLALLDLDRLEKLRPSGNKSDADLPLVSRLELEKARLALQDARSKLKGIQAKERAAQAEVQGLKAQLDYYQLKAPIPGILGQVQVVPGQTLAAGAPVADVINLDEIDVLCSVSPHLVARLALQQPAFLAKPLRENSEDETVSGKVVFISEQAQADTGNFYVKVRFPNGRQPLRANTIVRLQVVTQPPKKRVVIPESTLQEDQEPPIVVVADNVKNKKTAEGTEKVGTARRLQAIIGVRDREHHQVEILRLVDPAGTSVVDADDALYIMEGGHGLQNGDEIKIVEGGEAKKTDD